MCVYVCACARVCVWFPVNTAYFKVGLHQLEAPQTHTNSAHRLTNSVHHFTNNWPIEKHLVVVVVILLMLTNMMSISNTYCTYR